MALLASVLIILILLVGNEIWWRRHTVVNEFSRKFIHITVGTFVAFWPYFLSWQQIELLSLAFLAAVLISKYLHIFTAIHSVQRPTWGEIFFAAVVGVLALSAPHAAIYTAALLQMSLADGSAAIVGIRYGRKNSYKVLGSQKSIAGTLTFLVVSIAILTFYSMHVAAFSPWLIVPVALVATLLENIAVRGLDNLLVPLGVAALLALAS